MSEGKLRPILVGILNVTPDSFSDGGRYPTVDAAVAAAEQMVEDGAQWVDVGGESTRPGSEPVSVEEELRRVMPVIERLVPAAVDVSIDTYKPAVARAALEAGAIMVNDITALRNPAMREVCAEHGACSVCLMHMQGEPRTMQQEPHYDDVVQEVLQFLLDAAARAEAAGIARKRIAIDPGIGFGKTVRHNMALLRNLNRFVETGYAVMIGVSRKSFLTKLTTRDGSLRPADDRLPETLAVQVYAQLAGVRIIRGHDVAEAQRAIDAVHAISCSRIARRLARLK